MIPTLAPWTLAMLAISVNTPMKPTAPKTAERAVNAVGRLTQTLRLFVLLGTRTVLTTAMTVPWKFAQPILVTLIMPQQALLAIAEPELAIAAATVIPELLAVTNAQAVRPVASTPLPHTPAVKPGTGMLVWSKFQIVVVPARNAVAAAVKQFQ